MRSQEQIKEGPQDFNLSDDECSPVDSESVHSFQIHQENIEFTYCDLSVFIIA